MNTQKTVWLLPFNHWDGNYNDSIDTANGLADTLKNDPNTTVFVKPVAVDQRDIETTINDISNIASDGLRPDLVLGIGMLSGRKVPTVKLVRQGVTQLNSNQPQDIVIPSWVNDPTMINLARIAETNNGQSYTDSYVIGYLAGKLANLSFGRRGFFACVGDFAGQQPSSGRDEQINRLTGFVQSVLQPSTSIFGQGGFQHAGNQGPFPGAGDGFVQQGQGWFGQLDPGGFNQNSKGESAS